MIILGGQCLSKSVQKVLFLCGHLPVHYVYLVFTEQKKYKNHDRHSIFNEIIGGNISIIDDETIIVQLPGSIVGPGLCLVSVEGVQVNNGYFTCYIHYSNHAEYECFLYVWKLIVIRSIPQTVLLCHEKTKLEEPLGVGVCDTFTITA